MDQLAGPVWGEVLAEDPDRLDGFLPDLALLRRARTVTLWLGVGLGDQIALPWFCWLLDVLAIPGDRLRIVQFPADFIPRCRTLSLGVLTPEQIQKHPPARQFARSELEACHW